jgi:DNA invertase Pin-like site-specific DNA recombinase
MLSVMGAFSEFERSLIRERQKEGVAIAKAKGKYKGSKRHLTDQQATDLITRATSGESKIKLANEFGISRETLY